MDVRVLILIIACTAVTIFSWYRVYKAEEKLNDVRFDLAIANAELEGTWRFYTQCADALAELQVKTKLQEEKLQELKGE